MDYSKKRKIDNTKSKIIFYNTNNNANNNISLVNNFNNQIHKLTTRLDTFEEKLDIIIDKFNFNNKNNDKLEIINDKIKQLDYSIESLTKEISDLQVHALYGSLYVDGASKEIKKLEEYNPIEHLYY